MMKGRNKKADWVGFQPAQIQADTESDPNSAISLTPFPNSYHLSSPITYHHPSPITHHLPPAPRRHCFGNFLFFSSLLQCTICFFTSCGDVLPADFFWPTLMCGRMTSNTSVSNAGENVWSVSRSRLPKNIL